ncbi:MAG: BrnT family toxin [bacterium]
MKDINLQNCIGFEWDRWNFDKNWSKHKVSHLECEQVFFNRPLLLFDDTKHSREEVRMYVLGKTNTGRLLFVVFTVRNNLIRVISARNMNKKEQVIYESNTSF